VAQLEAGLSQRALATQWINVRGGEPYSQSHVRNIVAVVAEYSNTQPRVATAISMLINLAREHRECVSPSAMRCAGLQRQAGG
jgi:hypothetical protein